MKLNPETDLQITRSLKAPRALLWRCWTTPDHLKAFFMPEPHRLDACDVDLRPGGRFDTVLVVDGARIENRGVFLEVVPETRLVFTDTYSEGWAPAPDPFMTAILDFADAGAGETAYTATVRHRSAEARQTHEDMGFFSGWGTVATQLEAYARSQM
ncbi:SRPBCC family protein [Poseidonocella sedimentorum]|uniref:Uncharacterized conserved protein YndB, AHSA1/START domain n=1 Tax=Poseidonocella sedimentorum TaxID=871652 RepID=A0A1I6DS94_9RHOB|nr:SRPBCC family protein [Poseidonocella sedimentorum]SFR08241.1 Uncharacterized conserved protein YndB, AHSA1/START domain [Poseidonocella sedimentorum]